ncbi:ATP-binding protein [Nonomuraea sp. NPDC050556]|uniref:ATP-binding protein n=1 Tax=Nonomuraea sp. NPDC050556 TaxID=3364369 RepID=UPI0037BDF919
MGNLPAEVTSFVGRQRDQEAITTLLQSTRLITLTGVGGVGKTRLAVRAARATEQLFPDGAWLVELSSLQDPALLGHTVSAALRVADQAARPQTEVLAEYLHDRELLLILDTCEHLVDACADLTETILRAAPGVTVMTTTRHPLGVPGEACWVVEPLEAVDAVTLFTERAEASAAGFVATPDVVRLCEWLDGIPLAIELAAVRLRSLSVAQILDRFGDRFRLLSGGSRTRLARHQTLRTAVGWSHELCGPLERLMWARLSVFCGGFDLEAAQAVCAELDPSAGIDAMLVEELLAGLLEKSVVRRSRDGRYAMLDTVREYGADWLVRLDERDAVRRRHRDHFLGLARQFDAEWFGPDQVAWHSRMTRELPNLRAALDFCFGSSAEHAVGLDLAGRLAYFWMAGGVVSEGRHHLKRALAHNPRPGPQRNRALWACSWLSNVQEDLDEANDLATECMVEAQAVGDAEAAGWAMAVCAITGIYRGQISEALALYSRAEAIHAPGAGLAYTLVGQAFTLSSLGRPEEALRCLERLRTMCAEEGEVWLGSFGDWIRALIELGLGNAAAADRFGRDSLRVKHLLSDSIGVALVVATLAGAAAGLGDPERTARLLGIVALVEHTFGLRLSVAHLSVIRENAEREARLRLGDETFDTVFAESRCRDLDEALCYALTGV